MRRLAIFGNPVSHSLSPEIHALFAKQFNLMINYEKILVPINNLDSLDNFKETVNLFREQNGFGANITAPFKVHAFNYADQLTERAKSAGAVNTFIFKNNMCIGDNTDGAGFIKDLKKKFGDIKNKNILILGAGGAARGILNSIISENPKNIFIKNRSEDNAKKLINLFAIQKFSSAHSVDLIINTTSADFNSLKNLIAESNCFLYDLNYGEKHQAVLQLNIPCCDGSGMLIEQAAESFFQWFHKMPDITVPGLLSCLQDRQ